MTSSPIGHCLSSELLRFLTDMENDIVSSVAIRLQHQDRQYVTEAELVAQLVTKLVARLSPQLVPTVKDLLDTVRNGVH